MVVIGTSFCIGVLLWALVMTFRHKISYIFSNSEEVATAVSDLSVLLGFTLLLNSVQPVLSGTDLHLQHAPNYTIWKIFSLTMFFKPHLCLILIKLLRANLETRLS